MSRKYYRRYKNRNYQKYASEDNRTVVGVAFLILFGGAIILRLLGAIVNFLIKNSKTIGVIITVVAIAALVGFALYFIIRHRNKTLDKIIINQSKALEKIRNLNTAYDFFPISNYDMYHYYDNEIYYDSISPEDYLTYQLVYIGSKVKNDIRNTKTNAEKYSTYISEVTSIRDFGKIDGDFSKLAKSYIEKRERELFESLIKEATVQFEIKVELNLMQMNGSYITGKSEIYKSNTIEDILKKLSEKQNGFYLDPNIWEAISRVERGKVSNKMRFAVYQRDGNRCRKCGSTCDLEVDHIFPIAKGGKTEFNNLQTLCHRCNSLKSDTVERGTYDPKYDKKLHICPNCNVKLVLKNGKNGQFYACPNYPNCKHTERV